MVVIDVPHVFRVFGGPAGLIKAMDRHQPGHGRAYNTVQMWQTRKTIPSKWIGAVLYCCGKSGHALEEFLTDADEFVAPVTPMRRARPRG